MLLCARLNEGCSVCVSLCLSSCALLVPACSAHVCACVTQRRDLDSLNILGCAVCKVLSFYNLGGGVPSNCVDLC